MTIDSRSIESPRVAIACGGTGGHFFPGVAVAQELVGRGSDVMLLASQKRVDRESAKGVGEMTVEFLPSMGLMRGRWLAFGWKLLQSLAFCARRFLSWKPDVVLAMGGFTSVAPILVGKILGARVFLHESNSVPGRATRWLARCCDAVFVGFPNAATPLTKTKTITTGTPVRKQLYQPLDAQDYERLNLSPIFKTLLVMGGSQGAEAINHLMEEVVPLLSSKHDNLQFIHLSGYNDTSGLEAVYQASGRPYHLVEFSPDTTPFLRMASAVLSRSGASSLAEYAAAGVLPLLLPYPGAVDDHQLKNAESFCRDGVGSWMPQAEAEPGRVAEILDRLLFDESGRDAMQMTLKCREPEQAVVEICDHLLESFGLERERSTEELTGKMGSDHQRTDLMNEKIDSRSIALG